MLIKSYQERQLRVETKQKIILEYLRDETWSNSYNLAQILGLSHTAIYKTLAKFERQKLIKAYYISDLKFKIWGITQMGLLYSWSEQETMEHRNGFEPSKIRPVMIQHHLDLQVARFQAESAGWVNWIPGNLLSKDIKKRPDAVVDNFSAEQKIAVELERTIKTKKRYEAIFSIYLQAIKRGKYHSVHYVCPDAEFAVRMKRMFMLITSVPVAGDRVQLNEKHRARFPVYSLDQWPPVIRGKEIG